MAEIKLYKTTTKGLKLIAMSLPFVLLGLWMITEEPHGSANYIIGWCCVCFFGLGIPIGLYQALDKRPQIIISENGIWDRTSNQDEVKWEQILEAYPVELFDEKLISIATDDKFVFKNKPLKYAEKINKMVGAQNLNLHLAQIEIDADKLTALINKLRTEDIDQRRQLIKSFQIGSGSAFFSYLKSVLLYILISLTLLLITLSSFAAFMTITVIMGISAIIARWRPDNTTIRKYAGIVTWLGLVNLVLCVVAIKIHDNITTNVGRELTIEIEGFRQRNNKLPKEIRPAYERLEFNFMERYFANKIEYKTSGRGYELEAAMLFGGRKKYNSSRNEWE